VRSDLLKAIAASRDVTNAIILTHNIDFVFLQTVVLAAFRKCGHPSITVFADAQCAAESFAHQGAVLDGLGVRYRVVPVAMSPGFRFHPKAVLLSGEKEATLFVGSGNLTFGGWRENAEVWMRFDATSDRSAVFAEFHRYAREILDRVPLANAISEELTEAFDAKTRTWWTEEMGTDSATLLGRAGSGASLLDAFRGAQGEAPVDELVVCSPYFDEEGAALGALIERTGASRATVLCQPSGSTLTQKAFEAGGASATLQHVSFAHVSDDAEPRKAFIHAKFYGMIRGDQVLVIAGSANCSRAALVASGKSGNAELMASRQMPLTEFKSTLVGELQRVPAPIVLAEMAPETESESPAASLRVLAARYESGTLLIGFDPVRAGIRACEVDGANVPFSTAEPGIISAICPKEPRKVRLETTFSGVGVWSAYTWNDHERHLRASARGRGLVDSIRSRMQPGGWNAAAWAEVMDVFCKHLTYMPTREIARGPSKSNGGDEEGHQTFRAADVFSASYQVPALSALGQLLVKVEAGRERSLQQLLLRWFGLEPEVPEPSDPLPVDPGEDDDEVDRPEVLQPTRKRSNPSPPTEADKRRIQKVLAQVEEAMTTKKFLEERRPEDLATDLKVAAVLLRTGLREGWIGAAEFFRVTHRVWGSLFFSGSPESSKGWLEYRHDHSDDRSAFVDAIRSPELAAAMLGWAFAAAPDEASPAAAHFQLATALAVARLRWLWDGGDEAAVGRELEVLLAHTGLPDSSDVVATVREEWRRMLQRGEALLRFEAAAKAVPPLALRTRVRSSELRAGELLWQGPAGYCVVRRSTPRVEGQNVPVLRLQHRSEESIFKAPFTIPIGSLLDEEVIPLSPEFGTGPRSVLREFVEELRTYLGSAS